MEKMNCPFKVRYPKSGKRFLLSWDSGRNYQHLTMAMSEKGLMSAAKTMLGENAYATVLQALEVELVRPSLSLYAKAEEILKKREIDYLMATMFSYIRSADEYGLKIPSQFKKCTDYCVEPGYHDDLIAEEIAYETGYHFDCLNCQGNRFNLIGITPEEFYDRYHQAWEEFSPSEQSYSSSESESSAPHAEDHEKILAAGYIGNIQLVEVLPDCFDYLLDRLVVFYCKVIRELDLDTYQKMIPELKDNSAELDEKWENEKKEEIQNFLNFLEGLK